MKCTITILLIISCSICAAQPKAVGLTQEQRDKINSFQSIEKRLKLYTRYIHKDSVRYWREANRYWQHQTDSLNKAMLAGTRPVTAKTADLAEKARAKLERKVYKPWALKQSRQQLAWLDQHGFLFSGEARKILLCYFEQYFLNAAGNDSMLMVLKEKMPGLRLPRQLSTKLETYKALNIPNVKRPDFPRAGNKLQNRNALPQINRISQQGKKHFAEFNKYGQKGGDLSNTGRPNTLATTTEAAATNYASRADGFSDLGQAQGELARFQNMPGQYKAQVAQWQDSAYVKDQARSKAEEMAMNYIAENPQIMRGVQRKMDLLMKKYSFVPNSNDLSTAIKATSLKGKDFGERLVIGGNFQILNLDPFTIDLSPSIGYKLNRNFVIGIGGNYRQTFSDDSIPKLAPQVLGYKAFADHNVWRNFFAHAEFDRNSPGVKTHQDKTSRTWTNAAFAGVGRKIAIHRKVEMTVLVMYNFLHRQNDPMYPRPFVVKVGFQTSEIAVLKKRN